MLGLNSIMIGVLAVALGGGYLYYKNNEEQKARLIAEMAIKETQIALQEKALKQADRKAHV